MCQTDCSQIFSVIRHSLNLLYHILTAGKYKLFTTIPFPEFDAPKIFGADRQYDSKGQVHQFETENDVIIYSPSLWWKIGEVS